MLLEIKDYARTSKCERASWKLFYFQFSASVRVETERWTSKKSQILAQHIHRNDYNRREDFGDFRLHSHEISTIRMHCDMCKKQKGKYFAIFIMLSVFDLFSTHSLHFGFCIILTIHSLTHVCSFQHSKSSFIPEKWLLLLYQYENGNKTNERIQNFYVLHIILHLVIIFNRMNPSQSSFYY